MKNTKEIWEKKMQDIVYDGHIAIELTADDMNLMDITCATFCSDGLIKFISMG